MRAAAIFTLLLLAGCYDQNREPAAKRRETTVNTTLAELRRLYAGIPFEVSGDIVVAGYVTSSDREHNFYGSLSIEAQGAAAEIMTGTDRLFNRYPPGCRVAVRLQGLTVAENYGVLQFGRTPAPGSGYPTDYLGSQAAIDRAVIRTGESILPAAGIVRPDALSAALCGRLVRFEHMRYAPDELDAVTWGGYRRFIDADIRPDDIGPQTPAVYVFTRSYADWADEPVPAHALTLTGILQYGKAGSADRYIVKPRSRDDLAP